MFDGVGFKDKSFALDHNRYLTYKISLWKIASDITHFGVADKALYIVSKLQDAKTGGVYTFYSKDLIPSGSTNVETTAASIIAFKNSK